MEDNTIFGIIQQTLAILEKEVGLAKSTLLASFDINNISQIESEHVQMFLSDVSPSRAKSMDDIFGALRNLNRYVNGYGLSGFPYAGLLTAPRAREGKIYPCMP